MSRAFPRRCRVVVKPGCNRLDLWLWGTVSTLGGHLRLLAVVVVGCPILLGLALPDTSAGSAAFVIACMWLSVIAVVIQRSRDRFVAWQVWLRRGGV